MNLIPDILKPYVGVCKYLPVYSTTCRHIFGFHFPPGSYSTTRPCRPKVPTASQESSHSRCRGLQMPPARLTREAESRAHGAGPTGSCFIIRPHSGDRTLKAAPFEYARAASLSEVCALLATHGDGAKVLAGGQSLVPMMAMRLARPAWLVDINEIAALKFIAVERDVVRTGACARQCVVERDDTIAARVPLLRQALAWVGHVQTRNRGTIGGSLAHADPSAELPLVAQVLGARMMLRSGGGTRTLEAGDFFAGPMATAARPEECLEEI